MNKIEFQIKREVGKFKVNVSRQTVGASGGKRETRLSCHKCQRLSFGSSIFHNSHGFTKIAPTPSLIFLFHHPNKPKSISLLNPNKGFALFLTILQLWFNALCPSNFKFTKFVKNYFYKPQNMAWLNYKRNTSEIPFIFKTRNLLRRKEIPKIQRTQDEQSDPDLIKTSVRKKSTRLIKQNEKNNPFKIPQ